MARFLTDGYQSPVGDTLRFPRDPAPDPWIISLAYAVWYKLLNVQASIHTGIDLILEPGGGLGQPVYAIANGTVRFAKDVTGSSWRKLVVIEHTDWGGTIRCSRYGHLLVFGPGIVPGAFVVRGQLIGLEGNASGLFYPHLHFDVGKDNLLLNNPTNWPGDNLRFVLDNYENPDTLIRNNYPMDTTKNEQAISLLQQVITLLQSEEPPLPPTPSFIVVVKSNGTNIRTAPTTSASILAVVNTGVNLEVVDAQVNADGHNWYHIVSANYSGGYIAQDVVFPKA